MISLDEWERKLSDVKVDKEYALLKLISYSVSDLNKLIMNYLVIEGYKDAAEKFSQEASLFPQVDLELIQDRMDIRNAIQAGHVATAIEKVNDLDPEAILLHV